MAKRRDRDEDGDLDDLEVLDKRRPARGRDDAPARRRRDEDSDDYDPAPRRSRRRRDEDSDDYAPRRRDRGGPERSGATAALLECLPGFFIGTFGIGHIYSGNVGLGLAAMFGWWFFIFATLVCGGAFTGVTGGFGIFVVAPAFLACWLGMMVGSAMLASNNCKPRR